MCEIRCHDPGQASLADGLREAFNAPNREKAKTRLSELIEDYEDSYRKLANK
jgi:hypothetical protein